MELFQNKYRVKSTRLPRWDYGSNGFYFVAICTRDRLHFLGRIENGHVILFEAGQIASSCWAEIPKHFKNVSIDAYVIMPNHVHGIVVIDNNVGKSHIVNVETRHVVSLQQSKQPNQTNRFSKPIKGSLSVIVQQYKSSVMRRCRKLGIHYFAWQSRFYDHVIRDDYSLKRIREYIIHNPKKWEYDRDNKYASVLKYNPECSL